MNDLPFKVASIPPFSKEFSDLYDTYCIGSMMRQMALADEKAGPWNLNFDSPSKPFYFQNFKGPISIQILGTSNPATFRWVDEHHPSAKQGKADIFFISKEYNV